MCSSSWPVRMGTICPDLSRALVGVTSCPVRADSHGKRAPARPAARAALEAARAAGRAGARFPWESARTGHDVTPTSARDRSGQIVPIRTGQLEEHIVAEVPWAACCYVDWSGDDEFARGLCRRHWYLRTIRRLRPARAVGHR